MHKRVVLSLIFLFLCLITPIKANYEIEFLAYDKNKNLVYNKNFVCQPSQKFLDCIYSNIDIEFLKKTALEKEIYSFVIIKRDSLYSKAKITGKGDFELYKQFYNIFGSDIVIYRNTETNTNRFSEVTNEKNFDEKAYSLMTNFFREYFNQNKGKFVEDILNFKQGNSHFIKEGLYYKIYMITENIGIGGITTIAVNDPPIIYLYESNFNPKINVKKYKYLFSKAYETRTRDNNEIKPPNNIVRTLGRDIFRGFLLNIQPYLDSKQNGYYGLIGDNLIDNFNLFTFSLVFKLTGVPVYVEWSRGDNDDTSKIWKESLKKHPEDRHLYPLSKIGFDLMSQDVCIFGTVKCIMIYSINNGSYTFSVNPYFSRGFKNLLNKIKNGEIGENLEISYGFFCPTTKRGNTLISTFISTRETLLLNKEDAYSFVSNITEECKNFVKDVVNNFLPTNSVQCGNNAIKVYQENCEYSDIFLTATGIVIQDVIEVNTPIFYWIDFSPENIVRLNKPMDSFIEEIFNKYAEGNSRYCVGNRCAYFFLSEDTPTELKAAYPKMLFLNNFIVSTNK